MRFNHLMHLNCSHELKSQDLIKWWFVFYPPDRRWFIITNPTHHSDRRVHPIGHKRSHDVPNHPMGELADACIYQQTVQDTVASVCAGCQKGRLNWHVDITSGPVFIKHLKSNVYVTVNAIGSFWCNLCSHWLIQIFIT